jgi:hypothetical protein
VPRYPWIANALVVFDIGPLRPTGCGVLGAPACLGTPPRTAREPAADGGRQPTRDQFLESSAIEQFLGFLAPNGRFVDNCGARPCYAAGWTGP